jgi:hypothetical protein
LQALHTRNYSTHTQGHCVSMQMIFRQEPCTGTVVFEDHTLHVEIQTIQIWRICVVPDMTITAQCAHIHEQEHTDTDTETRTDVLYVAHSRIDSPQHRTRVGICTALYVSIRTDYAYMNIRPLPETRSDTRDTIHVEATRRQASVRRLCNCQAMYYYLLQSAHQRHTQVHALHD